MEQGQLNSVLSCWEKNCGWIFKYSGGMTSCGLVNSHRRFGGGRCLHLQCDCSSRRFCTDCADPEGEGSRFHWNACEYLPVAIAFYARGLEYSSPTRTLNHAKVSVAKWDISFVAGKDLKEAVFCFKNLLPGASCKCLRRNWQFLTYFLFLTTFSVAWYLYGRASLAQQCKQPTRCNNFFVY